jgi:hypothetical protein
MGYPCDTVGDPMQIRTEVEEYLFALLALLYLAEWTNYQTQYARNTILNFGPEQSDEIVKATFCTRPKARKALFEAFSIGESMAFRASLLMTIRPSVPYFAMATWIESVDALKKTAKASAFAQLSLYSPGEYVE